MLWTGRGMNDEQGILNDNRRACFDIPSLAFKSMKY
jgi:hypothetical protein